MQIILKLTSIVLAKAQVQDQSSILHKRKMKANIVKLLVFSRMRAIKKTGLSVGRSFGRSLSVRPLYLPVHQSVKPPSPLVCQSVEPPSLSVCRTSQSLSPSNPPDHEFVDLEPSSFYHWSLTGTRWSVIMLQGWNTALSFIPLSFFGQLPRRGRSPVEHRGNLSVRMSVHPSVPPALSPGLCLPWGLFEPKFCQM